MGKEDIVKILIMYFSRIHINRDKEDLHKDVENIVNGLVDLVSEKIEKDIVNSLLNIKNLL